MSIVWSDTSIAVWTDIIIYKYNKSLNVLLFINFQNIKSMRVHGCKCQLAGECCTSSVLLLFTLLFSFCFFFLGMFLLRESPVHDFSNKLGYPSSITEGRCYVSKQVSLQAFANLSSDVMALRANLQNM